MRPLQLALPVSPIQPRQTDTLLEVPRAQRRPLAKPIAHFERTDHETFCPFKGEASYWSLRVGEHESENTAWTYEAPFPEVAGLKDYVAFHADRVDWD